MEGLISQSWQVGEVLENLYEVLETLGENGVAHLYKVRHLGWNIDLMVKVPQPKILKTIGGPENFASQIKVWMNLGLYPHVVTCYYVRTLEHIPVVFTEYLDGNTLHHQIRQGTLYKGGSQQSQQRILDIAIQAAWGTHYIHEQGVIHSCIRPDNVLVGLDGLAKVTDLGMSPPQMLSSNGFSPMDLAENGAMTRSYCSPEQAKLQPLTPATDSWSWGLLLLEMFQGQRTWSVGTSAAGALKNYQETPVNSDGGLPQMPGEVVLLLRRCFRKNPSDRPSLLDLAKELTKIYQQILGAPYPRQRPNAGKETPESLNNQALCLIDLGEQSLALEVWEQALKIQPCHTDSVYNRGLILWRSGRINDKALTNKLEKLPRSTTEGKVIDYFLSLIHLERDDCDRALKLLERIPPQSVYRQEMQMALEFARERSPHSMRLVRTVEHHNNLVKSVCFSGNGRYFLSGSDHNTLKLWQVDTGLLVRTFRGHTQEVKCVGISGDSKYAISASWDKTLKLWDLQQGNCLRSFQPHQNEIFTICLSLDGLYALSGSDNRFNLWQIQTGECLRSFAGHKGDIFSLALSKDNQYALSGSLDKTVKLWDVNTGNCIQTWHGHHQEVTSVCFSADGLYALSGSSDHTLKLWQLSTASCVRTLSGHSGEVTSVCLSNNGAYALSGSSDHTLKLWQLSTGRCVRTFEGHTSAVTSVCLSPDNTYALSGSMDDTLKLWSVTMATGMYQAPIRRSRSQTKVETSVSASPQNQNTPGISTGEITPVKALINQSNYVAAAGQIRKLRESAAKNYPQQKFPTQLYFSAWRQLYRCLPREAFLAAYPGVDLGASEVLDSQFGLGETPSRATGVSPQVEQEKSEDPRAIIAVALSRDGRYAVSAGNLDKTLKLWTLSSGRSLRTFEGHTDHVRAVCLSANGTHVLSGSLDRTVKLWTVATGLCILTLTGHQDGVTSVCFDTDGEVCVSGSSDHTIKFWHLATGECLYTLTGHDGTVTSVCLTPDGRYVLSGSADTTLKIWDLMRQKCLHTFKGHSASVTSVSISADGYYALSGSADKTLKLWKLTECRCLGTLVGHTEEVTSVCLTPDGRYAISGSRDQTVKIWQVTASQCLHTLTEITGPVNSIALSADGSYALCGSDSLQDSYSPYGHGCASAYRSTLKIWQLDWELADRHTVPWDEGARPYLEAFLMRHTQPFGKAQGKLYQQSHRDQPTNEAEENDIPTWTEENFQQFFYTLGCAGYGWLEPAGVRTQLKTMAENWQWLSPFVSEVPDSFEEERTQLPAFSEIDSLEEEKTQTFVHGRKYSAKDPRRDRLQTLPVSPLSDFGQRPKVTLTVEAGSLKGRKFEFDSRSTCVIGRGKNCCPRLPNDSNHHTISRSHCLLDINPPAIRIRDLNSKNGTFVNGKIMLKSAEKTTELEYDLREGDKIKLGYTSFRVHTDPGCPSKADKLSSTIGESLQPGKTTKYSKFPKIDGYMPVKLLGQGRVSEVYSVKNKETGQLFALKVMLPQITLTQEASEIFQRDLENIKALHHRNIVQLYDYGYWDDRFFLILEYCQGGSITKVMQERGKCLSIDESMAIILQVLKGFDYAHNLEVPYGKQTNVIRNSKGLIHGRLNPGNIFFTEESSDNSPQVKLGDYGLDKTFDILGLSGLTMTGTKAFHPAFVPKKAIDIKYIHTDLDIWAAAASLYFLLTGQFARDFSGIEPWIAVLQKDPIPIRDRNPSIPKALAELIDLALVDQPHIRFKNAASFKRDLETVI